MSTEKEVVGSGAIPPSITECLHLLGAEYVAALLEERPDRATRFGRLLVLFSSHGSEKYPRQDPKSHWPGLLKEVMHGVVTSLPKEQRDQVIHDKLVGLNLSDDETKMLERMSGNSIDIPGPLLGAEDLVDKLLAGQIMVDNQAINIEIL